MSNTLTSLIDKHGGFDILLNTDVINDIFPYTSPNREKYFGLKRMGAAKEYDGRTIDIIATEPGRGISLINSQGNEPNKIDKLGWEKKEIGGIRIDEYTDFTGNDLKDINHALAKSCSVQERENIQSNILRNVSLFPMRRDNLLEVMFWQSCLDGVNLDVYQSAAPLQYNTNTTLIAPPTNNWTTPASSEPFKDIQRMKSYFRKAGMTIDKMAMSQATYENMISSNSIINSLREEQKEKVAQFEILPSVCGVQIEVYDECYTDNNGVTQQFLPDGKVVMFAKDQNPALYSNIQLFAQPNPDITTDLKRIAFTFGEYFYVTTTQRPTPAAILYGYSFNGGVGIINPKSIAYMTVY